MLNLREIRLDKNISTYQLESICGVSSNYITELEKGKYNPTVKVICALCKALNVSPNELIKEENWK